MNSYSIKVPACSPWDLWLLTEADLPASIQTCRTLHPWYVLKNSEQKSKESERRRKNKKIIYKNYKKKTKRKNRKSKTRNETKSLESLKCSCTTHASRTSTNEREENITKSKIKKKKKITKAKKTWVRTEKRMNEINAWECGTKASSSLYHWIQLI